MKFKGILKCIGALLLIIPISALLDNIFDGIEYWLLILSFAIGIGLYVGAQADIEDW